MPLPLNDGPAPLDEAMARGQKLLDDLLRHRQALAAYRHISPALPPEAIAEGEAALDRAIEAVRKLVSDLSTARTPPPAHAEG